MHVHSRSISLRSASVIPSRIAASSAALISSDADEDEDEAEEDEDDDDEEGGGGEGERSRLLPLTLLPEADVEEVDDADDDADEVAEAESFFINISRNRFFSASSLLSSRRMMLVGTTRWKK